MKFLIEYKFGGGYRQYLCSDSYEMERVIEFMEEKWKLLPARIKYVQEIEVLLEDETKNKP